MTRSSNRYTGILSIALGLAAFVATAQAQVTMDLPIRIADNADGAQPGYDTLYLGFKPGATNGMDGELGEEQQPPAPPEGVFDARWVNVGSSSDFGQGIKRNYHGYASPAQKDTFRIRLQPGFVEGKNGYPVTLSWPVLAPYFTSASLRFVDGDGEVKTLDMMTGTSFSLTNASSTISTITIATEGPKDPASSVGMARAAAMLQLEAAPNPATSGGGVTLSYTLPGASYVAVKVYNALGEMVAAVPDEAQESGRHAVTLDTRAMAPGGYYYTIRTDGTVASGSFILID